MKPVCSPLIAGPFAASVAAFQHPGSDIIAVPNAGIDFLSLKLPADTVLNPALSTLLPSRQQLADDRWYESVQDLRPHFPARICWNSRFTGCHKLQFIKVSQVDALTIYYTISEVLQVEPLDLEPMRVDFYVDIPVPLNWIADNVTIARKRAHKVYGETGYVWMNIGRLSPASPVTPPGVRVRTGRFGGLSYRLTVNLGIPSESK